MSNKKLLLVDDESSIRFGIKAFLRHSDWEIEEAENCEEAIEKFRAFSPDAAIIDFSLPDGTALDLLPKLKSIEAETPIVVLTGHGSIDNAVQTIKLGAENFLTKPVELPILSVILDKLTQNHRNFRKQLAEESSKINKEKNPFLGNSKLIKQLESDAKKISKSESPILITGETGTGKSFLARWIHENSSRSNEPFVELNCAGLNREFLETELFGHEKGAFTGAINKKLGLLEIAHHGTIFLDEIGDIDPTVQPKLLKVLEEKTFRRLGDVREKNVDVRLIAATNQDLTQLVSEKKFRSDLYFRINTFTLQIPSLKSRPEDIEILARYLLSKFSGEMKRPNADLTQQALQSLKLHNWTGNIRELRNVLERALILSETNLLDANSFRFDFLNINDSEGYGLDLTLEEVEKKHIQKVLESLKGDVTIAAQCLNISRSSLYQRINRFGLDESKD
jgi:DNA-binding NtrC family response regulator